MDIQSSGHIQSWIDIVGFKDMIRENGVDYVPGNPADYAIVQSNAWANLNCDGCSVESLTPSTSVMTEGNMTIATLSVNLKWSQTVCSGDDSGGGLIYYPKDSDREKRVNRVWKLDDGNGGRSSGDSSGGSEGSGDSGGESCTTSHYSESTTFQNMIESPHVYPRIDATAPVYLTRYPDMNEISIFTDSTNLSKVAYQYGSNSTEHTLKTGHVEQTKKGVYFANISNVDYWKFNGANISRFGENVLLNINATAFDSNKLRVSISNIYGTVDLSNFSVSDFHNEPERTIFNPVLFAVLGSLSVFVSGACFLIKRSLFRRW